MPREVGARAERLVARAGEHDDAHRRRRLGARAIASRRPLHHAVRHRVAPLGPVDRHPGDAAGDLVQHLVGSTPRHRRIVRDVREYRGRVMLVLGDRRCSPRCSIPLRHARLVQATARHEAALGLAARRRPRDPDRASSSRARPRRYWHNIGFGLLVASYVLVLAFCARNLVLRGMSIVFIGIACNALGDRAEPGHAGEDPARVAQPDVGAGDGEAPPAAARRASCWSSPTSSSSKQPFDTVLSFGDLILAVGLCDVSYNASRDPQRRRKKALRGLHAKSAAVHIDISSENGSGTT